MLRWGESIRERSARPCWPKGAKNPQPHRPDGRGIRKRVIACEIRSPVVMELRVSPQENPVRLRQNGIAAVRGGPTEFLKNPDSIPLPMVFRMEKSGLCPIPERAGPDRIARTRSTRIDRGFYRTSDRTAPFLDKFSKKIRKKVSCRSFRRVPACPIPSRTD
jgi:hypothetical protein